MGKSMAATPFRIECCSQLCLIAVALVVAAGCGDSDPPRTPKKLIVKKGKGKDVGPPVQKIAVSPGQELYQRHCAACHGDKGDGQGIAAAQLFPKPRDFRMGRFRLVSTTNRTPTREDLDAVLVRGMPGSSMPPWPHLSGEDRQLLIDEVLKLRREGAREQYIRVLKDQEELTDAEIADAKIQSQIEQSVERQVMPGEVTKVPDVGEADVAVVARGKEIYLKQGCQGCHGKEGKGDGQQKMTDDEGLPTRPRDFTRGIFKGGHDPISLYRRTAYGMPGTPMPSSSQLTPEQIMELVHYVRSLSDEQTREEVLLKREKLTAGRAAKLPESADASAWNAATPQRLRMTPLWWRDNAEPGLAVQALHDDKTLAVRLTWRDATADKHAAQTTAFKDAAALQLYRGDKEPFLGMGARGAAVDVWFWDSDRQDAPATVEDVYPNVVVDVFPFNEKQAETAEGTRPGAKSAQQPDISLPARASSNPIVPEVGRTGASHLTAAGPGSVTFRVPTSQLVQARGEWREGRWTVVMTRTLGVASEVEGVSLTPGERVSIAFAVWDGNQRDRDGQKLITIWNDLVLETGKQ
jgi:mono/diheme cytochrome c family protein